MEKKAWVPWLAGAVAGLVNGLFGAGGGMLLVPLLRKQCGEKEAFACSVCIILPLSLVSLLVYYLRGGNFVSEALPYLLGGAGGGLAAGLLLKKMKANWLHKAFGLLILWGGARLLLA